jgi:adenosylhomocysteinase
MDKAAEAGDIFITVTGDINVITKQHFLKMKDGAICANAGHFDVEVSRKDLEEICISHQEARKNIEGYVMPGGRTVYLMAEGRLVNLAAGDGHPAEIMDLSFAMQMLAAVYLAEHAGEMKPRVYILPHELDRKVAGIKLASMGYEMDSLTEEQKEYLSHE